MGYILQKPYTNIQRADFICEHQGLNYYEDDNCIIMYLNTEKIENGEPIDISQTPEYIAELEKKEKIRIANLRMTPRDFLLALTSLGVKFEDIEALLAQNAQARLELNYCQYVYRGNALLDSLCGTLGVTPEQLDELFEKV